MYLELGVAKKSETNWSTITPFFIILELSVLASIACLSLENNFKGFQYPHNPHNPPARNNQKQTSKQKSKNQWKSMQTAAVVACSMTHINCNSPHTH
jgi:hypothetical protein